MKGIIGKRIRKIRENKDYSQENVASELGITVSAYSKIERGETDANTSKLIKIAEVLEVDISDFFVDLKKDKTDVVAEPKSSYGFATKKDIDYILDIITDLKREIAELKK